MEQQLPLKKSSWWRDPESVATAKDYAILNGLLFGYRDIEGCTNVSVSLQPAKFPQELFQKVVSNQEAVNVVVDALSTDHEFLTSAFKDVTANDEFVRSLFEIYMEVRQNNRQTTVLGLHRTDYLINAVQDAPLGILQVEINTIASSYAGLQSKVNNFHEFIQQRFDSKYQLYNLPENKCLQGLTDGIHCAWKEYENKSAVVLFVVPPNETNRFDQRTMEFMLWQSYSVPTIRRTLTQLSSDAQLGPNNELIVSDEEVAVVYYRSGYDPSNYPSQKEWSARRIMELSRASCCPSVSYQLVGFKKIQDILAQPGVLERYLSDQATAARVRSTFAGFHSLDEGPEGDSVVQKALADPHKYVLKPQREGGGNNVYGDGIRQLLGGVASNDVRQTHILMDMINSPVQRGVLLTMGSNTATETDIISELGIFGVFVRKGDTILVNNSSGYLVRTKPASADEGGVSVGVASLNTVTLVSEVEYLKSCSTT